MKRLELFEFEDFPRFPSWIRTSITKLIVVFQKMMGTSDLLAALLLRIRERHNFTKIVDMGSGSGGPMVNLLKKLNEQSQKPIQLTLTDLHPNPRFVKDINAAGIANLYYQEKPLDATNLSQAPEGLKTMMNCFHHMSPKKAKQILRSAQENKQAILIYELTDNSIPTIAWWLFLPLSLVIMIIMVVFMTPFVRPLRFKQVFFTYIIPIIPIFYAWDGQASAARTYSINDIRELLAELPSSNYIWEVEKALKADGKAAGYYLLGLPK
jgi:hypothetical protein